MDPELVNRVLDLAIALQQVPSPTFVEGPRAAFIRDHFQGEALCDVHLDELGNVYGRLPGIGNDLPLVVCAHSDTVFPASTDLRLIRSPEKISGPGIGDNSLGVAGLFGLIWSLRHTGKTLPGDVWLVANVGEEGLGDLRGIRAVVDHFGDRVLAYLILEGMSLGQVYHRGLGVTRYRITVRTAGGHSWVDFGRLSAVHELAALIHQLTALPLPARPRTSLNVGIIAGGTTVNTIAAEAHLELDLRSEDVQVLSALVEQVTALVRAANRPGVQVSAEVIGQRPVGEIPASHPLVCLVERSLAAQGIQIKLAIGSTDANYPLSRGLPAVCLGLTTGGEAHTVNEFINIPPLAQGLGQLLAVVEGAFEELPGDL